MDRKTGMLIGVGSSICGAAAVMAAEPVVKARAEQVAVATVVMFGMVPIFLYPLLFELNQQWHIWSCCHPVSLAGARRGTSVSPVIAGWRGSAQAAEDQARHAGVCHRLCRRLVQCTQAPACRCAGCHGCHD